MFKKKYLIIIFVMIILAMTYIIVGRQIPIHMSNMKIGSKRIFYHETSRFIQCDVAYTEVVVHEDGTYEYVYELKSIGNGSCLSELYIWKNLKSYTVNEAIEEGLLTLDDFIDSDFVIKRSIIAEES